MSQAVKSNLFLYVDDSCLVFQGKDVVEIEKQLNRHFTNICEWFVDNRQSIYFGKDKTKSILFASKLQRKKVPELNITKIYKLNNIQRSHTYVACYDTMPGELMPVTVMNKIKLKGKFLDKKNKFLTPVLCSLLCNALIQPHFYYASSV